MIRLNEFHHRDKDDVCDLNHRNNDELRPLANEGIDDADGAGDEQHDRCGVDRAAHKAIERHAERH